MSKTDVRMQCYDIIAGVHSESVLVTTYLKCCKASFHVLLFSSVSADRPSSLDAMVFAYLFLMHEIPLVQCPMKAHIQACPPLCSFISHIRDDFTRDVPSSIVVTCKCTA